MEKNTMAFEKKHNQNNLIECFVLGEESLLSTYENALNSDHPDEIKGLIECYYRELINYYKEFILYYSNYYVL